MIFLRLGRCSFRLGLFSIPRSMAAVARVSCIHCVEALAWSTHMSPSVVYRSISTSHHVQAGRRWRDSQGESRSGHEYGPLVDLPDWEYADGRPSPQGSGQWRRQQEQQQIAERIDRLAGEMMAAVQKETDAKIEEQRRQYEIDEHKLKPKGQSLRKATSRINNPVKGKKGL